MAYTAIRTYQNLKVNSSQLGLHLTNLCLSGFMGLSPCVPQTCKVQQLHFIFSSNIVAKSMPLKTDRV